MAPPSRAGFLGALHYIEGWLSNNYRDAARYLVEHAEEMADQAVEDECATRLSERTEGAGEVALSEVERESLAVCPQCQHAADVHSGPHGGGCLKYVADYAPCPCALIERDVTPAAVERILARHALPTAGRVVEVERVAEQVLAEHEDFGLYVEHGGDTHYVCSCDETKRPGTHRAHLAAALAAAIRAGGAE